MEQSYEIMEVWKDIPGYEGRYQASNLGRIKSLGRHDRYMKWLNRELIIKQNKSTCGYLRVGLTGKTVRHLRVHRLVAMAFIPNPESKPQINHKDRIKTNNRVENLEWVTPIENIKHIHLTGFNPARGEKHFRAKLNAEKVIEIRKLHAEGQSCRSLSKIFGVSKKTLTMAVKKETWKHV